MFLLSTPDLGQSDVWHWVIPIRLLLTKSIIPLWSDYWATGYPVFASGQTGALFLPNLILFRIFPFGPALNLSYLITLLIFFSGVYFLFKAWGFKKTVSFFSAVTFTFSGFMLTRLTHLPPLQSFSLFPWEMYFLTRKSWLWLSLIISQQLFAGHQQMAIISWVGMGVYLLYQAKKKIKLYFLFILSILGGILLASAQILPLAELYQNTNHLTVTDAAAFPYNPQHLLAFLNPFWFGNPHLGTYPPPGREWGIFWESTGYIGILPLILALLGLFVNRKNDLYKFAIILLIGSLILTLGKYTPFFFIFQIPPLSFFHVPSRFLFLVSFSLILLAAITLEKVGRNIIFIIIIIFITVIDLSLYFLPYHAFLPEEKLFEPPENAKIILKENPQARVFSVGQMYQWTKIFFTEGWNGGLDKYLAFKEYLAPQLNSLYGINSSQIYMNMPTRRFSMINGIINSQIADNGMVATASATAKKLLGLQGVGYFINYGEMERVTALPRSFNVQDFKIASTTRELGEMMLNKDIDFLKTGILEKGRAPSDEDLANLTAHVFSRSYYPGWKAYADKDEVKIYPININQQAVFLPGGDNREIKFVYDPLSFRLGLIISLIGHIGVFIIFLRKSLLAVFSARNI